FVSVASGHLTLLAVGQVLQRSLEPALPSQSLIPPQSAPRSASRPKLLSICYLYRACVDRERSDLEDRRIFAREPA
ncbi:hypothetical protein GBB54_09555, partial [Bifidobacterium longum]